MAQWSQNRGFQSAGRGAQPPDELLESRTVPVAPNALGDLVGELGSHYAQQTSLVTPDLGSGGEEPPPTSCGAAPIVCIPRTEFVFGHSAGMLPRGAASGAVQRLLCVKLRR